MRAAVPGLLIAPLALVVSSALAQSEDPFAALTKETRPLTTRWQTEYTGSLELGLGYISDNNFMFGQYNGLQEDGVILIGDFNWNSFSNADSYWQASLTDLGLDTREGRITWGLRDKLKVTAAFDSQLSGGRWIAAGTSAGGYPSCQTAHQDRRPTPRVRGRFCGTT